MLICGKPPTCDMWLTLITDPTYFSRLLGIKEVCHEAAWSLGMFFTYKNAPFFWLLCNSENLYDFTTEGKPTKY